MLVGPSRSGLNILSSYKAFPETQQHFKHPGIIVEVVYNRWTGTSGLEWWNRERRSLGGQRSEYKFRYFRGSVSVATAPSPSAKIKLAKFVVCCMLYIYMHAMRFFLTYAPYTGNLTQSKKLHNNFICTWSC